MKLMFWDTETDGICDMKAAVEAPHQPHLVQFGAALVNDLNPLQVLSSVNLIVKPDGWEIPDECAAIHGITTEKAHDLGVPLRTVTEAAWSLSTVADRRVAHNQAFDMKIMRIALHRAGYPEEAVDEFKTLSETECTAVLGMKILKSRQANGSGRFPKLSEVYEHFFGTEHADQHSAVGDVKALMAVYWAIREHHAREAMATP